MAKQELQHGRRSRSGGIVKEERNMGGGCGAQKKFVCMGGIYDVLRTEGMRYLLRYVRNMYIIYISERYVICLRRGWAGK